MNIAVLTPHTSPSGISRVAIEQARRLRVPLYSILTFRPWEELLNGVDVYYLPNIKIPIFERTFNLIYTTYFSRYELPSDFLYITHQLVSSYLVFKRGLKFIPYIHDPCCGSIPYNKLTKKYILKIEKKVLNNAPLILCNSRKTQRQLKSLYNVDVIPIEPGIDIKPQPLKVLYKSIQEKHLNCSDGKREILFVIRLPEIHKIKHIIDRLLKEVENTNIYITGFLGKGGLLLKYRIWKLKKRGVFIYKNVSEGFLKSLYRKVDVVIQGFGENFGFPIVEAIAENTIPIAFHRCGALEYLPKIDIIKFESVDELINNVVKVLNMTPSEYACLVKKLQDAIIENGLTWDSHIERLKKILNNITT